MSITTSGVVKGLQITAGALGVAAVGVFGALMVQPGQADPATTPQPAPSVVTSTVTEAAPAPVAPVAPTTEAPVVVAADTAAPAEAAPAPTSPAYVPPAPAPTKEQPVSQPTKEAPAAPADPAGPAKPQVTTDERGRPLPPPAVIVPPSYEQGASVGDSGGE